MAFPESEQPSTAIPRRGLFNSMSIRAKSLMPKVVLTDNRSLGTYNPNDFRITRRGFLKQTAIVAASGIAEYYTNPLNSQGELLPTSGNEDVNNRTTYSLIDSAKQGIYLFGAQAALGAVAKVTHLPIGGNPGFNKNVIRGLIENPIYALYTVGIEGPAIEESIFRLLPSVIFTGQKRDSSWPVGILSSLVFASAHNLNYREFPKKLGIRTNNIPFPQFLSGLFLWKIMQERGYVHAATTHSTLNLAAVLILVGLAHTLPEKEREKLIKNFGEEMEKPKDSDT